VSAGVSALMPLLAVAGADVPGRALTAAHTSTEGINHTVQVATAAVQGNYIGPLIAAVTFVSSTAIFSTMPS